MALSPSDPLSLHDVASALILLDPEDEDGWERARVSFRRGAKNASLATAECLRSVVAKMAGYKKKTPAMRQSLLEEIQGMVQHGVEEMWNNENKTVSKTVTPVLDPPPVDSLVSVPPVTTPLPEDPLPESAPVVEIPRTETPTAPPCVEPVLSGAPKESSPPPPDAPAALSKKNAVAGGKFLTFFLAQEEYGVEILKVQEIIALSPITMVPRTPEHIRGVINLRGKIIPVVDLRRRLGLPSTVEPTSVIIVRSGGEEVGATVDRVNDVARISDEDIHEVPDFGIGIRSDHLLGIGRSGDRVRLLLDIDRTLEPDRSQENPGASVLARVGGVG